MDVVSHNCIYRSFRSPTAPCVSFEPIYEAIPSAGNTGSATAGLSTNDGRKHHRKGAATTSIDDAAGSCTTVCRQTSDSRCRAAATDGARPASRAPSWT